MASLATETSLCFVTCVARIDPALWIQSSTLHCLCCIAKDGHNCGCGDGSMNCWQGCCYCWARRVISCCCW
ncbi:uncharacterized protein LY79DRAFT_574031 [Colletotrichum navitas]|uniref:Uncharacterized protein n=1 Tax=Colletotrichum navitas TaxID=681940 RepID=A0AAD8PJ80_9PEZI|nr:uncharacterized protein LY79DRAFT_574031 [Colletotrichum navitas]KAK1561613.1 hypothetical protein LY79DRAFT_574031 [Colletotrichum navitas]